MNVSRLLRHSPALLLASCVAVAAPWTAAGDDSSASGHDRATTTPHWIWTAGPTEAGQSVVLQSRLRLDGSVQEARMLGGADFCHLEILVNGRSVGRVDPFADWFDLDCADWLGPGDNDVELRAASVAGPAAVAARLTVRLADGTLRALDTDASWRNGDGDVEQPAVVSYGRVEPRMWVSPRPVRISPFDDYTQWKQALGAGAEAEADPATFLLPAGFAITHLASAKPGQSSWVSLALDDEGRLLVAREDQGLLRLTIADQDEPQVETVAGAESLAECRGLLFAYDALYVNANNSKALYRLRDTHGDGRFDETLKLRDFPGNVGHGRNDLALGADGSLYSMHGDAVELPKGDDVSDRTSPFREARRGQATREGHLVRFDRDGRQFEIVCSGLRNPFGVAFHKDGDPFTYDADAEFDMGAPWYRPTRIVQLVSGADYGWRGVTGSWPPYFPDHGRNCPPVCDIGKGSPTAVAFGYGSSFPYPYRDALFVLDWAYGRVIAVHLSPRGAGYRARTETFLRGQPLNVTDLAFGRDGAMYLVTGGRGTQSALYRVEWTGPPTSSPAATEQRRRRATQATQARALRRDLAKLHRPIGQSAVDEAWPHLASSDPLIRDAARIAVEHQDVDLWRDRALQEPQPQAALEAAASLAAAAEPPVDQILQKLNQMEWQRLSASQQILLLHCARQCLAQSSQLAPATRGQCLNQLLALLRSAASHTDVLPTGAGDSVAGSAARLLLEHQVTEAVPLTMRLLLDAATPREKLACLYALRQAPGGWTLQLRREFFAAMRAAGECQGGDGMPGFLQQIREEATATLSDQERAELGMLLSEARNEQDVPKPRPVVRRWTMDDLAASLDEVQHGRNHAAGQRLFHEALCARCHRVGSAGRAVGPDLTAVGGRFHRRDILEAILSPSKVVAEKYRNVEVLTVDGRRLTGRALDGGDYRSPTLRLATDPLRPAEVVELPKRDIARRQPSPTSPMPDGLLDSLTRDEILDLMAYLQSAGNPRHPAYQQ